MNKEKRTKECCKRFQKALEKRKKQSTLDYQFKDYIKKNYPQIYKEAVKILFSE